ncbi:MAG: MMPL family transporter [Deltaproteobacteria bacterium]|nr:MMPL family transporter [Deltaproteobacteria bacterium]MCB9786429.1 MMPL family transporter [Deltaproteobacteria bacterium]
MERFARWVTRHSVLVLCLIAALSVLAAIRLPPVYDDDVVRFLPQEDPEVVGFNRIAERFGSLSVALVGVQADADTGGLYTHDRLTWLRELTKTLEGLPEVAFVTGISELAVITGEEEAEHKELVPKPVPTDPAALQAIRDDILGLDYLAGTLVSTDGTSAMLVCQLRDGQGGLSTKDAAEAVREAAAKLSPPPGTRLHFAGAPFIAEAAANGSQRDLARLAPYVVGVILLLILLSLGSFRAAMLTVGTVGLGILWTLGAMAWLGQPLTLISSSLPVILVALGSAYAVHLLVWYLEHGADEVGMLANLGWPIIVTGLTTVAGFLSFLVMDLAPMREFGWQMALGTAICSGLALCLVPAVLHLLPLPPRKPTAVGLRIDDWMVRLALWSRAHRLTVLAGVAAVAVFFGAQIPHIETRMDTGSFFEEGSEPAVAERFMEDEFGGSVFLQVLVSGDIRDPAVLDRIAAFEDRLRAVPGVTRVDSIANVLAIVHEGLKGQRRLSRERKEIAQMGFLARRTDPAVGLLVDEDWSGALIQVGIGGFDTGRVTPMTARIRALAARHLPAYAAMVPRGAPGTEGVVRDAAERIAALAGKGDEVVGPLATTLESAARPDTAALGRAVKEVLDREIGEDEMMELSGEGALAALEGEVAAAAAARALTPERFIELARKHAAPSELEDDKSFRRGARYLETQVSEAIRPLMTGDTTDKVLAMLGELPAGVNLRVAAIVDDLLQPEWVVGLPTPPPGAEHPTPMTATVSGYPVLQQAMTDSVQHNQTWSLMVSMPLVLLVMVVVFRSLLGGLLGAVPSALTLLVTFGLMGLFPSRLPLDIGASMLSSIALGTGIDYAIHFMWRYREGGLRAAMRTTGRSILINAAEITAGFVILAWATIVPMSRFGLLTAETLLVAALATLVILPALLDWWKPAEGPSSPQPSGEA